MPILVLKDKRFEFDPSEFSAKEAIAIEKATGLTWREFLLGCLPNTPDTAIAALTGLVWMVRRRNGEPTLLYQDVDFLMGEVDWDLDDAQKAAWEKAQADAAAEAAGNPPAGGGAAASSPQSSGTEASPKSARSTGSPRRKSTGSAPTSSTV